MRKRGRIFVVSAPSGCGKTTICKRVLQRVKNLVPSISLTTRAPRPNEKNKRDYHYVLPKIFKNNIKEGSLLEWEKNFGYLYGTPKDFVLKNLKEGKNLLLSIDIKGAMNIRKKFPDSVLIFIKPPSLKQLKARLKSRNTDKSADIEKRLKVAKKELDFVQKYDYVVVNKRLRDAVNKVVSIINKEG